MNFVTIDRTGWRPPAPTPNSEPLGPLALLRALWKNPLEAWAQVHFEQPAVAANLVLGHVVLVNEPAAVRRVLVDNAGNYRKDRLQQRVLSAGLGQGLLASEGEQWRMQRRILAPLFSRKTVMSFAPAMTRATDALIEDWRARGDGAVVDLVAEMARLTIGVLEQTIFSDGLGRARDDVRNAMTTYFEALGRIDAFDVLGLPEFLPRLSRWQIRGTMAFFNAAIDDLIAARRRSLAADRASVPRDLLTLLLQAQDPETGAGMSEAEVRANVLTFISAGQETTANALTWSLFLLSQSQEWRERVTAEAEREIDGPLEGLDDRLVETRAVIDEAMRLYPPIVAISRAAVGADELAGQAVKPGTLVCIAPYVLHRHRRMWERPDIFDPGRFLPETRGKIDRFAYLPFGVGPRICIGSAFALQEATLALAAIMKNFRLELVPGHDVWPVQRVTLRPRNGLRMVISRRQPH